MKKILIILIIILTFNFNYIYAEVLVEENNENEYIKSEVDKSTQNFDITSNNIILYNLNDLKVLYELNSNEKVEIASLTKIMTTLVAIENIKDLTEEVKITSNVFTGIEEYSQAGLKIGDKVTYLDLLYGIMLPSGADAANALVLNLTSNQDEFIKLMNNKAQELNLNNTKFDNAIGMDSEDNYSTASDLATLLIYALNNETFKTIFTAKSYTMKNINLTLKSTLQSYGKSLDVSNITGAKSGFTDGAGLCLASTATINDVNYLLIVLGSDTASKSNAVKDTLEIYNYYDKNYSYQEIIKKDQILQEIKVKWGKTKTYKIKSDKDIKMYLKNTITQDQIKYEYEGLEEINYKNKKGDKLGTITIVYEDQILTSYDVYLDDTLEYYHPILYTTIAISIILMFLSLIQIIKNQKKKKRKKRKRKVK